MSAQEAKKEIVAIRRAGKAVRKSPASAMEFLVKCKILTPKGDLTKRFRG